MTTAGSRKTKAHLNKSVVVFDPKTELTAVTKTRRAIHTRIIMLDALGFFQPADAAAARHKKMRRTILKNTLAESETPE